MNQLVLLALVGPCSLLAGVILGAWIMHRATTRQSPVPNVARTIRNVIEVFKAKPKPKEPRVHMPHMRA